MNVDGVLDHLQSSSSLLWLRLHVSPRGLPQKAFVGDLNHTYALVTACSKSRLLAIAHADRQIGVLIYTYPMGLDAILAVK